MKVGDRVRVIKVIDEDKNECICEGEEGIIKEVKYPCLLKYTCLIDVCLDKEHGTKKVFPFFEYQLELIPEKKEEKKPKPFETEVTITKKQLMENFSTACACVSSHTPELMLIADKISEIIAIGINITFGDLKVNDFGELEGTK